MPKLYTKEMKDGMIRMRIEERASITKIAARFGVSAAGVWPIVKDCGPKLRPSVTTISWTPEETRRLNRMWPTVSKAEIAQAFPNRTIAAIGRKAATLGIRRERTNSAAKNRAHPLFMELWRIRKQSGLTRKHLADILGYHHVMIARWELGESVPSWGALAAWADALGCDLHARVRRVGWRDQDAA